MNVFQSHHIEEHVVAQVEARVEGVRLTLQNSLSSVWLQFFVGHQNSNTTVIKASSTSSAGHLDILTASDGSIL
jgi:aspartate ammonia-lyase